MSAVEPLAPSTEQQQLVTRLHRIEGQIRGIERMVDEHRDTSDVLAQIAAARMALEGLALKRLEVHVTDCVDAFADGAADVAERKRRELLGALDRFARTH